MTALLKRAWWKWAIVVLAPAAALALYLATHVSIEPSHPVGGGTAVYYFWQTRLKLPTSFTLESGRISLALAEGRTFTSILEIPHQPLQTGALEALRSFWPKGGSQLVKDLSQAAGRPAQLVLTPISSDKALASLVADYGQGALRLSRVLEKEAGANFETGQFESDTLAFVGNYTWGHHGVIGPDERHSLHGRLKLASGYSEPKMTLLFRDQKNEILFTLTNEDDESARFSSAAPPSWLNESLKVFDDILSRVVQAGSREVAGQPGYEWVALQNNLAAGTSSFQATWRADGDPKQRRVFDVIMISNGRDHSLALGLWETIIASAMPAF